MKLILIILLSFFTFYLILFLIGIRFRNPYKLIMVFGKKGCGKTTTLAKLSLKYQKKGWTIYSTEPVPFAHVIKPEQIGFVQLMENSILLVDEVGMVYDSRNFRQFRPEVRDFFKLQRHYKVRCYLFSQSFDIDKKLRDLTDEMYLLVNLFNVFSYGKRIRKSITLTKAESDRPSCIAENLEFDSLLLFWAGSRLFTYIPKYVRYFQSFAAPSLATVEFPYCEPPELKKKDSLWKFTKLFKK